MCTCTTLPDERWPRDKWHLNPDAPYQQGDIIKLARGNEPPTWEVLCVGRNTYYLKSLNTPSRHYPEETIWTKWSCEQATVLESRKEQEMQITEKPCHNTTHCVNWDFCPDCAPEFSKAVLERYTVKGRQTSGAYTEAIAEVKAELAVVHHEVDEMDAEFQDALVKLAKRCSACGQPLPQESGEAEGSDG